MDDLSCIPPLNILGGCSPHLQPQPIIGLETEFASAKLTHEYMCKCKSKIYGRTLDHRATINPIISDHGNMYVIKSKSLVLICKTKSLYQLICE